MFRKNTDAHGGHRILGRPHSPAPNVPSHTHLRRTHTIMFSPHYIPIPSARPNVHLAPLTSTSLGDSTAGASASIASRPARVQLRAAAWNIRGHNMQGGKACGGLLEPHLLVRPPPLQVPRCPQAPGDGFRLHQVSSHSPSGIELSLISQQLVLNSHQSSLTVILNNLQPIANGQ